MVVNRSVPASSVPEFITYTKANPGKLNMASIGTGSTSHIAGVLFQFMTGVNMIHVPYRGDASALTDLLGGQGYTRRCFPKSAHGMGASRMPAYRNCGSVSAR
jgi:tripartite-type tricarboxylate transporter receptor subunit TctC